MPCNMNSSKEKRMLAATRNIDFFQLHPHTLAQAMFYSGTSEERTL